MKLQPPFIVVCIDSDNKKPEIDNNQWLKEGHEEIVTSVFKDLISGETSYKLLDKNPEPYKGYLSSRFKISIVNSVN